MSSQKLPAAASSRQADNLQHPISYHATIRHLRAFLSVARLRSFTQAALELHLSQPSLTMTIKQLEDIVGGALFDRTTRRVTLTAEAHDLLPMADRLVSDFDTVLRDIRLTASTRRSCIRIAAVHSVSAIILPRILKSFLAEHPRLRVQIREGNSAEVRRLVHLSEVDVGFASKVDDPELTFEPFFRDQLGLFAHCDHPLLGQGDSVAWKELASYDFIGLTEETATSPILEQIAELPDSVRVPKFEVSNNPTLWALVANGLAVTTAPAVASVATPYANINFRGLHDPIAWRQVCKVVRVGRVMPPKVAELVDAIASEVGALASRDPRIELLAERSS